MLSQYNLIFKFIIVWSKRPLKIWMVDIDGYLVNVDLIMHKLMFIIMIFFFLTFFGSWISKNI